MEAAKPSIRTDTSRVKAGSAMRIIGVGQGPAFPVLGGAGIVAA